jgi:hypothetical protein
LQTEANHKYCYILRQTPSRTATSVASDHAPVDVAIEHAAYGKLDEQLISLSTPSVFNETKP